MLHELCLSKQGHFHSLPPVWTVSFPLDSRTVCKQTAFHLANVSARLQNCAQGKEGDREADSHFSSLRFGLCWSVTDSHYSGHLLCLSGSSNTGVQVWIYPNTWGFLTSRFWHAHKHWFINLEKEVKFDQDRENSIIRLKIHMVGSIFKLCL